jgi:hypothetical protein
MRSHVEDRGPARAVISAGARGRTPRTGSTGEPQHRQQLIDLLDDVTEQVMQAPGDPAATAHADRWR